MTGQGSCMSTTEDGRRTGVADNQVAVWAGVAAFFASLLAIGLFDVFDVDQWAEYIGAIIVAAITAGAVYAKERLDAAKKERNGTTFKTKPKGRLP